MEKRVFFFKQKTAYEMRISDWSSDVCSSDLPSTVSGSKTVFGSVSNCPRRELPGLPMMVTGCAGTTGTAMELRCLPGGGSAGRCCASRCSGGCSVAANRSEEHTSALQSLMRSSYAVFCLKKNTIQKKLN